ncbi:ABC transporter ATP-binding protein [Nocardia altamirensis]|uniref:ABC transporter ATP-binding protein n=1 Tax=Nocardia altamirensis TaxID=472158 RepID=UPI0009FFB5B2|nr:ABC transporter ATP-binding protein [Nocardia altamirensis]
MTGSIAAERISTPQADDPMAVRVEGLGKYYPGRWRREGVWALRDCSFEVPKGRVAALVGRNGAGKTTLLSVLSGLLTPTEGVARIEGVDLTRGRRGARVSFVAQDKPLYRRFTAMDTLRTGADLNRVWDQDRALRWLHRFEVPLDRPCATLSGGQQAQVSFALALGAKPSVLLLDEPLANLDPLVRREVMGELLTDVADTGMTVLLSTHIVTELAGVADYLLLLADGALRADGDLDDILEGHRHIVGPRADTPPVPGDVLHARHTETQSTFLVRISSPPTTLAPPWTVREVTLEDFVLAHLDTTTLRETTA